MKKESKLFNIDNRIWQILLTAFFVSGFLHVVLYQVKYADGIVQIFDGVVILCWTVSILRRIVDRRVRWYLGIIAVLMAVFFMLQFSKYKLFEQIWVLRYTWYAFYIPMILIPLFLFYIGLFMNMEEDSAQGKRWYLLFIPAVLLIIGILTNDLHFLAFHFPDGLYNQTGYTGTYSYGPLYFLVIFWEVLLVIVALVIILKKCGTAVAKKLFWIPTGTLLAGACFLLLGVFGLSPKINGVTVWQLTETYIYTMILFLESCIQIGLIPANTGYEERFGLLNMPAAIYDRDGNLLVHSARSIEMSGSDEIRLEEMELSENRVVWAVDLKEIQSLNHQIMEVTEQIHNRNERLVSENQMKEEQASLNARNNLYDQIAEIVKPQLDQIQELLNHQPDQKFDRTIAQINVLNVYIKRRSNMELMKADTGRLPVSELIMAIRESMEYLKDTGIEVSLSAQAKDELVEDLVILAYEKVEEIIESCLGKASRIAIFLTCKDHALRIRILIDNVVSDTLPVSDTIDDPQKGFRGYVKEERHKKERIVTIMLQEGGVS